MGQIVLSCIVGAIVGAALLGWGASEFFHSTTVTVTGMIVGGIVGACGMYKCIQLAVRTGT